MSFRDVILKLHYRLIYFILVTNYIFGINFWLGAIQVLRDAVGEWGSQLSRKKRYEGVWFNVISLTMGWVGGGHISREKALRNT